MGTDGREYIICQCGQVYVSSLMGEGAGRECGTCGRSSLAMQVADHDQLVSLPEGYRLHPVIWTTLGSA